MAVIRPFTTTVVSAAAAHVATTTLTTTSLSSSLSAPTDVTTIVYQRVYGVTINISDDGLESADVLTTVSLA